MSLRPHRSRCPRLAVLFGGLAVTAAAPAGAAAPMPTGQGGAAELVFAGRPVVEVAAAREAALGWASPGGPTMELLGGPEVARRDADLGVRGPARAITAGDTWPVAPRPSIDDYRRLNIPTSGNSLLVYQPGSAARSDFFRLQRLDRPVVIVDRPHRHHHHRAHRNVWTPRPR